jgi:hypothetical protein
MLEGDSIGGKLGNAFVELLSGHLILVQVKVEGSLIVEIALLLNIERGGVGSIKLLDKGVFGVLELLEEVGLTSVGMWSFKRQLSTYGDGKVVAASEFGNLPNRAKGGTHDDGLVAKLLVVVEDLAD